MNPSSHRAALSNIPQLNLSVGSNEPSEAHRPFHYWLNGTLNEDLGSIPGASIVTLLPSTFSCGVSVRSCSSVLYSKHVESSQLVGEDTTRKRAW